MHSIHTQLSRSVFWGVGVLLLVAFVFLENRFRNQLAEEFDRNLLTKTMTLVTLTTQEGGEVELDFADEFMPEFEASEHPEYFELWVDDGSLLERSRSLKQQDLPRDSVVLGQPLFRDIGLIDGRKGRLVQIRFIPHKKDKRGEERNVEDEVQGSQARFFSDVQAHLSVARGREELDALIWSTRLVLTVTGAIMLMVMLVLLRYSISRGLQPLLEISNQVRSLDADSLTSRIQPTQNVAELDPIVTQLNRLIDRLADSFAREKRFSGNVAHELRTPLAELKTMAEVGGNWPGDKSMAEEFYGGVLGVAEDMEKTVSNLLALARCEAGNLEINSESINLAELVRESWKPFSEMVNSNSLVINNNLEEVVVSTDRHKIELILQNLFSNAVEYSPSNEQVRISLEQIGDDIGIRVANRTQNLESNDIDKLFDRFWRKDSARTRGQHGGLGLSLVKALADVLKLKLNPTLDNKEFAITLSGFSLATA